MSVGAPAGTGWQKISGRLRFIVCSQATNGAGLFSVFGANKAGAVYYLNGVSFSNGSGTGWRRLSGARVTQIAIGWFGRIVYCVTWVGSVYRRTGITSGNPAGTGWSRIPSSISMKALGISPTGEVYAVGTNRVLYYRSGITSLNLSGTSWISTGITGLDRIAAGLQL